MSTYSSAHATDINHYLGLNLYSTLSDFGPVPEHRLRRTLRGREMMLGEGGQRQPRAERYVPENVNVFGVHRKQSSDSL